MQAKITIALFGLIIILAMGCTPSAPTLSTEPVTHGPEKEIDYVGRVIDANTLKPIANAKVTLDLEGVPPIVYTDHEGIYRFRLLISSKVSAIIRVDVEGYQPYTRNITVPSDIPVEDIRLTPTGNIQTVTGISPPALGTGSPTATLTFGGSGGDPSPFPTTIPTRRPNTPIPPTNTPVPTITPVQPTERTVSGCVELLDQSWVLEGSGPLEEGADTVGNELEGRNYIRIVYDLHGFFALTGDASAIILDQPDGQVWHYISLSDYGQNGYDGTQTVDIPLSAFPGLNIHQPVGRLHTRFWSDNQNYYVEVFSIQACT